MSYNADKIAEIARRLGIVLFAVICLIIELAVCGLIGIVIYFSVERNSSVAAWISLSLIIVIVFLSVPLLVVWYFYDMRSKFERGMQDNKTEITGTMRDLQNIPRVE